MGEKRCWYLVSSDVKVGWILGGGEKVESVDGVMEKREWVVGGVGRIRWAGCRVG